MTLRGFNKFKIVLFAMAIAAFSCKNDKKTDVVGDVVFSAKGTLDGLPLNIEAGKENYYMFSDHQVVNNLTEYIGTFKKSNCADCRNILSITLFDSLNKSIANPNLDSTLFYIKQNGFYRDSSFNGKAYKVKLSLQGLSTNPSTQTHWNFGDGTSSNLINPEKIYTETGYKNIQLNVSSGTCNGTALRRIFIDTVAQKTSKGNLNIAKLQNPNIYSYSVSSNPNAGPYSYKLFFGDGDTWLYSQTMNNQKFVYHGYNSPGVYKVRAEITNNFSTEIIEKNISVGVTSCEVNFEPEITLVTLNYLSENSNRVKITWVDNEGIEYSSSLAEQGANSKFEILDSKPYKKNEQGKNTYQITVKADCNLISRAGKVIRLENAILVFAVAVP